MMLITQLHEVLDIRGPTVDPMPDMVHIRELGVRAAGEATSLVAAPDLQPLGVAGITPGPSEVEAAAIGPVRRDQDLGVAGEPAGDFS